MQLYATILTAAVEAGFIDMKSYKELRKRIEADKENKQFRRAVVQYRHGNLDNIATYKHAYDALRKCNKNSGFKKSVQEYNDFAVCRIDDLIKSLRQCTIPNVATDKEIIIRERGKARIISPIVIGDREMQHIIADNALTQCLGADLIHQNCANQHGKGTGFARQLVLNYLEQAKKRWGDNFYVLSFDFKNFFGSIRHDVCFQVLRDHFRDERIIDICMQIIESYQIVLAQKRRRTDKTYTDKDLAKDVAMLRAHRGIGICLGSQISQDMAVSVPGCIDRYIKSFSLPYYVRFADDGIVIWHSKQDLIQLLRGCSEIAESLGLSFHPRKTQIIHIRNSFVFLKRRYRIVDGKTIQTIHRSNIARMRKKLHRYRRLVADGRMTLDDVYASLQSWTAHTKGTRCRRSRLSMDRLYYDLFGGTICTITKSQQAIGKG